MKKINSGIIVIYKEEGVTSRDAVNIVSKKLNAKAGHIGTLDPKARGVLPILLGQSCKLANYLIEKDKKYITRMKLGVTTDTLDLEGKVIFEDKDFFKKVKNISEIKKEIFNVIENMKGKQLQKTPIFSSRKIDGQKLYEIARKDISLAKEKAKQKQKEIYIYDICNIKFVDKYELEFELHVSSGTYIRQVISDIAEKLGTVAVMTDLERIAVSNMSKENSIKLEELNQDVLNQENKRCIFTETEILENTKMPKIYLPEFRKDAYLKGLDTNLEFLKKDIQKLNGKDIPDFIDGEYLIYISSKLYGVCSINNMKVKRKYIILERLQKTILEIVEELYKFTIAKMHNITNNFNTEDIEDIEDMEDTEYIYQAIWEIIQNVTGISKTEYLKNVAEKIIISEEDYQKIKKMLLKFASNIPLAYITNTAYIYGYSFYVDENVLIPRYDSEILIHSTIKKICEKIQKNIDKNTTEKIEILELCTGSAALSICVLKELEKKYGDKILEYVNIYALDISKKALEIAKKNISKYSLDNNIHLICSDMFKNLSKEYYNYFDIIFANPPYIREDEILELDTLKEPHIALFGGKDGLKYYIEILEKGNRYLKNTDVNKDDIDKDMSKYILLEIGYKQRKEIENICNKNNLNVETIQDLAGRDRVCIITLK
ncbi:MAG: tRNA pseudouridine(55) synthase TruB [Clostridium sp.]